MNGLTYVSYYKKQIIEKATCTPGYIKTVFLFCF